MADKTVADLPKKNAAPAEPAKSLQATVQQVMNKAITSPTDAKVDFAQGVNHITGDPQQKSAGAADPMPTLKAEKEADKEKETVAAAYEADEKKDEKEKEDMKEVAHKDDEKKEMMMKASKDKEEVKEGELPAGLKKYLDKKDDKSEEKEDEKKDVKEVADKEKEMKKEVADKEKEKDMKEVAEKDKEKEVKEVADKEDEKKKEESYDDDKKKKEMSEAEHKDEKEVKKETAKDKVKDMDMKEDVNALTEGEDLSEEFKAKAATIFETAVKTRIKEQTKILEAQYEEKLASEKETIKEAMTEKVDSYLNYVVEEWMKENELAVERGLKGEIAEDFIAGLKQLFEDHYVDIPDEKYDVLQAQSDKIAELEEKVNKTLEESINYKKANDELTRNKVISESTSDLTDTQIEKFKELTEDVDFENEETFKGKVETLKESYFPKEKKETTENIDNVETGPAQDIDLTDSMAAYTKAISNHGKGFDKGATK